MVDEREFVSLLKDIYQTLGRVEQKVDSVDEKVDEVKETARENTRERDRLFLEQNLKLDALAKKQSADNKEAVEVQKVMVGQIGALEAPLKRAAAAKKQRALALAKIIAIGTSAVSFLWIAFQPIWNVVADLIAHRLLGVVHP